MTRHFDVVEQSSAEDTSRVKREGSWNRAAPTPTGGSRDGGIAPVVARRVVPVLQLVAVFVVLARVAMGPLDNFDTYFHLRFGHEFLGEWTPSDPGSVSTFATADWVSTQWLAEEVMARMEISFGLSGVAWLLGFLLLSLALTFYLVARRWCEPLVAAPLVIVALIASITGLSMRPQVISYLLVAVTTACWLVARQTGRAPWLLIPVTWAWAMLHGMWPVGVVISAAAVIGLLADKRLAGARVLPHVAVPVLSGIAAGFLTPAGPRLFTAVVKVNSRREFFSEWSSPEFTRINGIAILVLLGVTVLVLLRRHRPDWTTIILVGLAAGWTVYSLRTVPVAAAMMVPIAAMVLGSGAQARRRLTRSEVLAVGGSYVAVLVTLVWLVPSGTAARHPQPEWLEPELRQLPAGTKVLDPDGWGAYLMWRFPQLDLTAHGYGDTFTTDELQRNVDIERLEPGWDDLVRDTQVEYAVLEVDSPLAYALREQEEWQVLRDGPDLVMLQSPPGWMAED